MIVFLAAKVLLSWTIMAAVVHILINNMHVFGDDSDDRLKSIE